MKITAAELYAMMHAARVTPLQLAKAGGFSEQTIIYMRAGTQAITLKDSCAIRWAMQSFAENM